MKRFKCEHERREWFLFKNAMRKRCASCVFWNGDTNKVREQFNDCKDKDVFLKVKDTTTVYGMCSVLSMGYGLDCSDGSSPETNGVFGCIMHEEKNHE